MRRAILGIVVFSLSIEAVRAPQVHANILRKGKDRLTNAKDKLTNLASYTGPTIRLDVPIARRNLQKTLDFLTQTYGEDPRFFLFNEAGKLSVPIAKIARGIDGMYANNIGSLRDLSDEGVLGGGSKRKKIDVKVANWNEAGLLGVIGIFQDHHVKSGVVVNSIEDANYLSAAASVANVKNFPVSIRVQNPFHEDRGIALDDLQQIVHRFYNHPHLAFDGVMVHGKYPSRRVQKQVDLVKAVLQEADRLKNRFKLENFKVDLGGSSWLAGMDASAVKNHPELDIGFHALSSILGGKHWVDRVFGTQNALSATRNGKTISVPDLMEKRDIETFGKLLGEAKLIKSDDQEAIVQLKK